MLSLALVDGLCGVHGARHFVDWSCDSVVIDTGTKQSGVCLVSPGLVFCRSRLLISAGGNHSATFFFLIGKMWQNSTSRVDRLHQLVP